MLIDTTGANDTIVVASDDFSGPTLLASVKFGAGPIEKISDGGGGFLTPLDIRDLEIKSGGGTDIIDVRGVTAANGYDKEVLDGHIELKGQSGNDTLYGSPFDDILEGRNGDDVLVGGDGNDVYRFDARGGGLGDDTVVEAVGGGTDTLDFSRSIDKVTIDLGKVGTGAANKQDVTGNPLNSHTIRLLNTLTAGTSDAVENVVADFESFDDDITGNSLDNILLGHKGNDKIHGEGGDDHIEGGDGDDSELYGGDGNDIISGGPGVDTIYGNAGDDLVQGDGFGSRVKLPNPLKDPVPGSIELDEASGIINSRANTNILFTIEDAGNGVLLYANDKTSGISRGYYTIGTGAQPASNVDWEDLAFYHDTSANRDYIYVADIGDNDEDRSEIIIYRVEEPTVPTGTSNINRGNLSFEVIKLKYPGGSRNAETLLVEPAGPDAGKIYIVSKSEPEPGRDFARLYGIDKASQVWQADPDDAVVKTLVDLGETNFRANTRTDSPSGGDISPKGGREVVIKSDNEIHVYFVDRQSFIRSIDSMLTDNEPTQILDIRDSKNRESIGYDADGDSLFTVTEEMTEADREIHRYDRVVFDDLTITANRDIIYGGDPTNTSNGQDLYIGDRDLVGNDEVKDFSTDRSTDLDLIVGLFGDVDFDGEIDFDDIDDFTDALISLALYFSHWGLGAWVNGDIDEDGDVDFDDLDLFVDLLL